MRAGRSRGNLDGPVQEDPGRWRARSRRTRGGGPGRQGASGRSSGCTVIRRSAAGRTRLRGSGRARRPGSEQGPCCAAHVLTSAAPTAGAAALGEKGGTGRLPVDSAAPPPAPGRPLTDRQAPWFRLESTVLVLSWCRLYQAHPQGLQGRSGRGQGKDELDWAERYCPSEGEPRPLSPIAISYRTKSEEVPSRYNEPEAPPCGLHEPRDAPT